MKVVLFCGGLGTRIREYTDTIPKPMIPIGYRPMLWHLMKYYAHFGHRDFILCLGYRGDVIKQYFLNYDECLSNDFVLSGGGPGPDPAEPRHPGLDHQLRRHGPALQPGAAPQGGRALSGWR